MNLVGRIIEVFVLMLVISVGLANAEPTMKYVNVSFDVASPITLNEPVAINVTIDNEWSDGITLDLGLQGKGAYHFVVITPDNKQIDMPPQIQEGNAGPLFLQPKDRFVQRLLLNEWYPFDVPGDYKIMINLQLPIIIGKTDLPFIIGEDADDHQVEEAEFNLTILPHDGTVLRQKCDALLAKLKQAVEFPARTAIADELSYINDPVAIPYLAKLVEEREEAAAIRGLMRIGSDEALEAMVTVTQSEYNKAAASSAKALLRQKIHEIRDPLVKEKVRAAVE